MSAVIPAGRGPAVGLRARPLWRHLATLAMLSLVTSCTSGSGASTTTLAPTTTPGAPATPTTSITTSTSSTTATTSTRPAPAVSVDNLGLAAVWLHQLDDGVAIGVSERDQGTDLNDDGDRDDVVAHVVGDDRVTNTGMQGLWGVEALDGGGFFINVPERDAAQDLNADGDMDDSVPQVWTREGGVTNVGFGAWATPGPEGALWLEAVGPVSRGELRLWRPNGEVVGTGWVGVAEHSRDDGAVLIGVFEEEHGEDLDGDGRLDGHVVVLWRQDGVATVIGPAYQSGFTSDGGVWRTWSERDDSGVIGSWHLAFWHPDRESVDLPHGTVNHSPTPDGGLIFRVSESVDYWGYNEECLPGSVDLNRDGDCGDFVLHRWSPDMGLVDLGLPLPGWCPECDWGYVTSGDLTYASQPERLVEKDLDDDGAITEAASLQLVEDATVRNLGLEVTLDTRSWAVLDEGIVVLVPEVDRDLNGDGDHVDRVFSYVSREGAISALGIGGWLAQPVTGDLAVLLAGEEENGRDLNGDGAISDDVYVVLFWRVGSHPVLTGITNGLVMDEIEGWRLHRVGALPDGTLVVLVPERDHGHGDLNSDGDVEDLVAHTITLSP